MLRSPSFRSLLLAGVAGLSLLAAACAPLTVPAQAGEPTRNTLSVTGTGSAYGAPDIATLQIGVQSRNADPKAAVDENSARMNALTQTLTGLGLDAQDLQTANFSVSVQQDYDPVTGQPKSTFTYVVDNTLTVRVRDLARLGDVLGQAVGAGANSVYGVSFTVSEPARLEAEARERAMADARARAEALAQAAGVTLGDPITISEYLSGPQPLLYADKLGIGGAGAAPVPVAAGQLEISLQVNVTYEIR